MNFRGQRVVGFVVYAENLLADFVGPTGEEAGLRWGGPALDAEYAGDVDFFLAEEFEQAVAGLIFADGGDGNHLGAQSGEIIGGIGAAAGDDLGFAVLEDEDGSFAGDASDVAELESVGDEIAEDGDGLGGKALDVFGEGNQIHGWSGSQLFFGALRHLSLRIQCKRKHTKTVEMIQVADFLGDGAVAIEEDGGAAGGGIRQKAPPRVLIARPIRPWRG